MEEKNQERPAQQLTGGTGDDYKVNKAQFQSEK